MRFVLPFVSLLLAVVNADHQAGLLVDDSGKKNLRGGYMQEGSFPEGNLDTRQRRLSGLGNDDSDGDDDERRKKRVKQEFLQYIHQSDGAIAARSDEVHLTANELAQGGRFVMDLILLWHNDQVSCEICSEEELQRGDDSIIELSDTIVHTRDFEAPEWDVYHATPDGSGAPKLQDGNSKCADYCGWHDGSNKHLCNAFCPKRGKNLGWRRHRALFRTKRLLGSGSGKGDVHVKKAKLNDLDRIVTKDEIIEGTLADVVARAADVKSQIEAQCRSYLISKSLSGAGEEISLNCRRAMYSSSCTAIIELTELIGRN